MRYALKRMCANSDGPDRTRSLISAFAVRHLVPNHWGLTQRIVKVLNVQEVLRVHCFIIHVQ